MNMMMNRVERSIGIDLNNDGYIGGEGMMSRLERATHIDFNGDNIIGRRPDVLYGYPSMYGYGSGILPMAQPYAYRTTYYGYY
ncbi:hypothetical protein I4U23_001021 [Adineta vaga]|nr:hypothetical protein I4U23_001021 [Adineta vaga]